MPDPYRDLRRIYGATSQVQLLKAQVSSTWDVSKRLQLNAQEISQLKSNINTLRPRVNALPNSPDKNEMSWQLTQSESNYQILLKAQDAKVRADIARQQQMAADLSARVAQQAAAAGDAARAAKAAEVAVAEANAAAQASRTPAVVEQATATASAAQKAANDAFERSMQPKSECFLATAAYGSPLEPEVESLRRFRHQVLDPDKTGHIMVRTYYVVSPPIARGITRSNTLRSMVRTLIGPLVNTFGR